MLQKDINTAAPSDKCLHGGSVWDERSLDLFASAKKCTQSGSPCKTILSSSGDLVIEVNGVLGYEITETSFNERGWE